MGFFFAIIGIFVILWIFDKALGISNQSGAVSEPKNDMPTGIKKSKIVNDFFDDEFDDSPAGTGATEIILCDNRRAQNKVYGTNFSGDVLYVGSNVLVEGDELVEEWQLMHVFPNGMARIYSNRPHGYQNEERDVNINRLKPIHYLK